MDDKNSSKIYLIGNMTCADCAKEVEAGVGKLPGVQAVKVDFATGRMHLDGDVPMSALWARVEALGKTIMLAGDASDTDLRPGRRGLAGFWDYLVARPETRLALIGGGVVLATGLGALAGLAPAVVQVLYTVGMCITLYPILRSGAYGLLINRQVNINLLMTIATFGAIAIGEYLEGATMIFLFAIGEALEGYTTERARNSIKGLLALRPAQARRLKDGVEESVPIEALTIGDSILVKPGENIPADGYITRGASGIDQAPITGESIPVAKSVGDEVYAGTINGNGALTISVTRLAEDNTLSRIIALVEQAQSARAPSQRLIDRFAAWYTPAIVGVAALVAVLPPLLGAPLLDTPDARGWLYRALAMLMIACPCALVISTPVTVISAISRAAQNGVLIKGGAHLEALGQIRAFAFDKTGTLTAGKPEVTAYRAADCAGGGICTLCDDVLALAMAVERQSAHPLAEAVVRAAHDRHLQWVYAPAEAVETLAGRGVRGQVGAHVVTVGSHPLFDEAFPHSPELCQEVTALEDQGQTTMLLAEDGRVRGYIGLADTPRPSSRAVIAELRQIGLITVMLTGDNPGVAQAVGLELGVGDVRAGLLPAQKVEMVSALQKDCGTVAMVGDGINDTPALAAATVGIAMGGAGSPQALETADIALMADDLARLPFAIKLARLARRLIRQNIVLSLAVKVAFLLLAFFGLTSLWLAILADVGMLLVVTLNGMRPLRTRV